VLCGAFMITLAAVLLFFLIKPIKTTRTTSPKRWVGATTPDVRPFFDQASWPVRQEHLRNNLAYQRFYVDHSLIRP
jgi:hypothetical protein